ncbi:hypothetical protein [Nitratifractor salsuginis]|uniref:Uncharacterized protein n=1 Tax=Nitratifractor salsuginis (strain DSM 16511 / JCM 12458 / E9I37-1) TaxID=749222 RepID=E6WZ55_NITSE|nr:hypothetical protein [Nitratifractor salsuginis]ADV45505.1 hypothetical protein Nitsa_0233 [Nitratifractor salsuginis DSM 16511]
MKRLNDKYLRWLVTTYRVQAILGVFPTLFGTILVAVMSTDAPGSGTGSAILGGLFAFFLLGFLTIFVPLLAAEELEHYPKRSRLFFNLFNLLLIFFLFWPLALWEAYALYRTFQEK